MRIPESWCNVNLAETATFFRMCKNMRVLHSHADREDVRSSVCPATHKDASTDTSVARMEEVNCKENGEDNSVREICCMQFILYVLAYSLQIFLSGFLNYQK